MSEKVRVTLRLQQEALELALRHGYATRRTLGEFLSQLILDYHQRHNRRVAPYPSFEEWQRFKEEAEQLLRSESGRAGTEKPA
ncbi:MAG: hypothetical protein DCC55_26625 [Chloroflexi bacterium]|nr:MAG: hypothetical protein DCC55_26625 [Chloroflexota bacterium]